MFFAYYMSLEGKRQRTIGGTSTLSRAKEMAEERAGKSLRWYKHDDGTQRAHHNQRTYVVYEG